MIPSPPSLDVMTLIPECREEIPGKGIQCPESQQKAWQSQSLKASTHHTGIDIDSSLGILDAELDDCRHPQTWAVLVTFNI